MAILTEDTKRVVHEQQLGCHPTIREDGSPNLSPEGTTYVLDDDTTCPSPCAWLDSRAHQLLPSVDLRSLSACDPTSRARRGSGIHGRMWTNAGARSKVTN
jgi:hypothetical protein